jgi:hypothetical protein
MAYYSPSTNAFDVYAKQFQVQRLEREKEELEKEKERKEQLGYAVSAGQFAEGKRMGDIAEATEFLAEQSPYTESGKKYIRKPLEGDGMMSWLKNRYGRSGRDRVMHDPNLNEAGIERKEFLTRAQTDRGGVENLELRKELAKEGFKVDGKPIYTGSEKDLIEKHGAKRGALKSHSAGSGYQPSEIAAGREAYDAKYKELTGMSKVDYEASLRDPLYESGIIKDTSVARGKAELALGIDTPEKIAARASKEQILKGGRVVKKGAPPPLGDVSGQGVRGTLSKRSDNLISQATSGISSDYLTDKPTAASGLPFPSEGALSKSLGDDAKVLRKWGTKAHHVKEVTHIVPNSQLTKPLDTGKKIIDKVTPKVETAEKLITDAPTLVDDVSGGAPSVPGKSPINMGNISNVMTAYNVGKTLLDKDASKKEKMTAVGEAGLNYATGGMYGVGKTVWGLFNK